MNTAISPRDIPRAPHPHPAGGSWFLEWAIYYIGPCTAPAPATEARDKHRAKTSTHEATRDESQRAEKSALSPWSSSQWSVAVECGVWGDGWCGGRGLCGVAEPRAPACEGIVTIEGMAGPPRGERQACYSSSSARRGDALARTVTRAGRQHLRPTRRTVGQ